MKAEELSDKNVRLHLEDYEWLTNLKRGNDTYSDVIRKIREGEIKVGKT
jgi:predicted CopG family antitoxin